MTRSITLTVALLTDLAENVEELRCGHRQRVQVDLLEIFRAVLLQMAVTLAQAAHHDV